MKKTFILCAFLIAVVFSVHSENIYLFSRLTFANSQFWEKNVLTDSSDNVVKARRVFSNFFTGSIGAGVEMVIWDNGIKRGSRIYFKSGFDVLFSGPSFFGVMEGDSPMGTLTPSPLNGGAFYAGFDMDLYVGGTFPKTDLLWGFGSMFYFTFPGYSPLISVDKFDSTERFAFYAAPFISLAYDIFIPNTKFKITPQIRTGITCNPLIPNDLVGGMDQYDLTKTEMYSGFYVDISVAFSFYSVQWKK